MQIVGGDDQTTGCGGGGGGSYVAQWTAKGTADGISDGHIVQEFLEEVEILNLSASKMSWADLMGFVRGS